MPVSTVSAKEWQPAPAVRFSNAAACVAVISLPPNVLSKPNRLSLKTDRFRIEREGKTLSSALFTYLVATRKDTTLSTRFAVLVSKKGLPLSVDRHQLKRRLTEIIRHHLVDLSTGLDIILIPKRPVSNATDEEVLSDLLQTLKS